MRIQELHLCITVIDIFIVNVNRERVIFFFFFEKLKYKHEAFHSRMINSRFISRKTRTHRVVKEGIAQFRVSTMSLK